MSCIWTRLAGHKWMFLLLLIVFPACLFAQTPNLGDNILRQFQACPVVKEPDTCQRTFFKEYTSSSGFIRMRQIMKSGKDFLIPAIWRTGPNFNMDWLGLVKMDTAGHLKETRLLGLPNLYISKLIALRDGNFLIFGTYGNTSTFAELYFAKIDPQLNIIWEQKLTATPYLNGVADVVESKDGDLYCYIIDHEINNIEARLAMKLTATGQPVWLRKFNTGPNNFLGQGEYLAAIVELGDDIILKYNEEVSDYSPHLMSLKKSDGSINWVRKYQMDGPYNGGSTFSLNTLLSDGINIYMQGYTQSKDIFLKIRPDGSVSLAKKVVSSTVFCGGNMSFRPDGHLLVNVANINLGGINGVLEMDTSFNVLRSQYMQRPGDLGVGGIAAVGDSLVYESGTFWNPDAHIASLLFVKYNFNSSFGNCEVPNQPFVLSEINQPTVIKTVPQSSPALPVQNAITTTTLPLDMCYAAYYCGNAPTCTDIKLQGPTTICDTSSVYSFKVEKNAGCNSPVGWRMDTIGQQVHIVSKTDAEMQLKVLRSGNFKIRSSVIASCGLLEDSISVSATAQNTSLNLGKDTVLCEGSTINLHAEAWFSSYQWQDGSTDSVFTVKAPGLYYVQVAACGNLLSDSIVVQPQPKIPFYIGPDRTKCNADTLHLNAPSGFISYSWGPNYNISSSTAANAIVHPLVDTIYYVKAQKSPGCFVYDSVAIKVNTSPAIDLGRDTSFCIGNEIILSAPSTFSAYLWNTGASAQQITVSTSGSYNVRVQTIEGCYSSDTIIVTGYPLPAIKLDKNPEICYGGSRLLDAGNFNSYVWQNGSTSSTLVATSIGTYYVTVTDQHGCVNSDTTVIRTVVPVPSGFLPPEISLCSYETKELKPSGTYQQYLWSNGVTNSSINITRGGLYWLQAVDSKGCKGVDSTVVIAKDCMEGVYIPTAFSPNNDRRNDEFRVLAFGKIQTFELTLYNRWGQIVFRTNDRLQGWDGKVAGRLQDSGTYIWTCQYKLEGQPKQSKKGTFMLIR